MTNLTLYYTPGTCAQAVRIGLEEAGAPYDLVRVDFAAAQQRTPEYLAVNPKGRVPALVTPHGTLTETPALLAYVAQSFPEARLAPADAHGFARMQEFHSYLASTVHIAHAHRPRASRWADEPDAIAAIQRKVPQNMTECFNLIESHYLPKADQGPWVMGEQYTVADGYLFTIGTWLKSDGVDISSFPKVFAHTQRMLERPAVQRALA
ncbi:MULTISPECIES: glutathione S-transferase family protein [unclassified Acidovorax]|uniref:glutathione S-transferase family protein n=1 Tax=unclassified Acidovorax TaxID=2684926 RepID=UPI001C45791D|nr:MULTISPECIES: glutathione S-transferase family protein [unclassified Acidovorax]MBV7462203.1 glutathione S-transferase family protein [Acidovorax sp. sif0632]MBV7467078.1 glutathione S-transferase family protein [Acidovorax sp. sif0613]